MKKQNLDQLRLELSVKAKNGIDFILAATIVWTVISFLWSLDGDPYNTSVFTFIIGSILLPLAFAFSKLFKTQWKIEGNPLQPLGLILNFAQLFYFPFLVFLLMRQPEYFLMGYIIITGAHLFPYFWFYNQMAYAVFAGLISVGGFLISINLAENQLYLGSVFTAVCLLTLFFLLRIGAAKNKQILESQH